MIWRSLMLVLALAAGASLARAGDCRDSPPPMPGGFVRVVQRNAPAVVQVVVLRPRRQESEADEGFELFQPLQGAPLAAGEMQERTFSSGFFIAPDGLLVATAHAVREADEVWVVTADERRLRAAVLGVDAAEDVALLKVEARGMPVVQMAPRPELCAGQWLVAIGTPFGFERSVTAGVVSAYPRYLHGRGTPFIQSDVALNPGSSGGPLFSAAGTLVGMSTMIYSANGVYDGASFALPADVLLRVARVLQARGGQRTGDLGVRTQPLTPELAAAFGLDATAGTLVAQVRPGGAGARAGLRAGDVVLGFAPGERLPQDEVEARLATPAPGSALHLELWRDGAVERVRVEVDAQAEAPAPAPAAVAEAPGESRLGLVLAAPPRGTGLIVDSAAGSALLAGIEPGDRIAAVNGRAVASVEEFDAALARAGGQRVVALLVGRFGTTVYLPVRRMDAASSGGTRPLAHGPSVR